MVVGDIIIDEYIYCSMQGMMSKDMRYSTRYHSEQYLGGFQVVARHIALFSNNVTLLSVLGLEENIHSRILNELSGKMRLDLIYSEKFATLIKADM